MRKHYVIAFPTIPALSILLVDYYQGGKHRKITLQEAKDAVFKAVLQGHQLIVEDKPSELVTTSIIIVDKDEFERSRDKWITENAGKDLKIAMDEDRGLLP